MKKAVFYFVVGLCFLLVSCISTNDLIYLQNKSGTQADTPISEVMQKPYRLQINDVVIISIKANDPKLVAVFSTTNTIESTKTESSLYFDGFTIDDHGNIRIPILGEMNAVGFTVEELRIKIENQLLAEYFKKEANIFVSVKLSGFRYTINGEVGVVGTKILFQENVNIMEAIANSGDITVTGDRKAVTIIRQSPSGVQMHDIDLTDRNVMKSPYFHLQPNDYVYVKPLKQKSWGTGKTGIESLATIMTFVTFVATALLLLKL